VRYYVLGNSSALMSLPNQFRVHAHWSSSDGVDTHTAHREILLHIFTYMAWDTDLHETTIVSSVDKCVTSCK
jgi:hypothetical protein